MVMQFVTEDGKKSGSTKPLIEGDAQQEIKRLKKEIARLKEERDEVIGLGLQGKTALGETQINIY